VKNFSTLRDKSTKHNVKRLSEMMLKEDGVAMGVKSFYRNLPLANMVCEVSIFNEKQSNIADFYCVSCDMKMCSEVDQVIHRKGGGRENHTRMPFR
jgi:tartrate dehydratase alpha subunit/fumarate hydratase class I-like protein